MLCRLIAPEWLKDKPKVLEGLFTESQIAEHNAEGYNVYYRPNYPKNYKGGAVNGTHIDVFKWVFVDYDVKSGIYEGKEGFIDALIASNTKPTKVVDSGNGIHAYWKVTDLDAKSFLRLSRRLMRLLKTDEAVQTLGQLMRLPGTLNTKDKDNPVMCEVLTEEGPTYTCEELDKILPPITIEDEQYCQQHYDRTFNINQNIDIDEKLPPKFGKLIAENPEAKELFAGNTNDRSKDDFRLGHLMFANGFTKDEALSVLVNTAKAMSRAPVHRANYARNIVDKIWTYEETKQTANLSPTVKDILQRGDDVLKGTRFPCHRLIDDTHHGFRLGQVIGIIGGSGVGKTTLTLNAFLWFAQNNPDYHHFFFSLEQPEGEIANRIRTICQGNETLYDKIHIVSNYDPDGTYRHFSMDSIEAHLLNFEKETGFKVGATVIDHIGVVDKQTKNGENDGLIGVCRKMKALAVRLNMMLIMLSQAPREKAGAGDLELDKSAAYGTVFFESFVDYCICLWQPLKRVYHQGAPTVMAIKFAKIRHKRQGVDRIQEDVRYQLFFDPASEQLRELNLEEERSLPYYYNLAATIRKQDKKTDVVPYVSRREDASLETTTQPDSDRQTGEH